MGGTIKIIKFFDESDNIQDLENKFLQLLASHDNQKVVFALNLYNFNNEFLKNHKNILKFLKQGLKQEGRGARFLNKPNENLKSVVIFEEKLDKNQSDLNAVKISGNKYLLGQTVAVQNFKKYSFRDYERPARDSKSGMLPPKLAQMMINLACEGGVGCTIYDPFCGSGTVLMEALLMGYKAIGSDISEKAIKDSEANLAWLKKNYEITYDYDLFLKDATKIEAIDLAILPGAVVSEVYLGPPQSKFPSDKEMQNNFAEVEKIISGFLKALNGNIRQGGNIVLALPYYSGQQSKNYFLRNLNKILSDNNYEIERFEGLSTDRGSLLYSRKGQIVGREIFKLKSVEK
jgi:tRNA G10  N-methylase Trm11